MELKLYKTVSSNNEINKTLTDELIFDVHFKKRTDILSPEIPIHSEIDLVKYNYAYIEQFERYYFIEEIEPKPNKIYRLRLRTDVIESFKDDILNSRGRIVSSQKLGYVNSTIETDVRRMTEKHESNYVLNRQKTKILTTIGG